MRTLRKFGRMRLAAAAALGTLAIGSAQAVENGSPITPLGVFDFGAGMLPPPSPKGTLGIRYAGSRATEQRDNHGDRSPVRPNLKVNAYSLAYVRMTDSTLAGAKYGWGVIVPVLDLTLDLTIPTPAGPLQPSGRNQAVGDVQLIPLMLQWAPAAGLFTNAQFAIQAPTGSYRKERLVNAGTNHWTLAPSFSFTWIQPGGFEVSSSFQININQRNSATDYRSGIEYQHEFAVGQHVGPWTLGLGGYIYRQLTDDKAPRLTHGNRSRVTALGPTVQFLDPASGWPALWVHAYREFGARNRTQGNHVAIRAAWTF